MGKNTKLTSGAGKHSAGRRVSEPRAEKTARPARPRPTANNFWERLSPAKRALIVLAGVVALAAVLVALIWACLGSTIKPPDITDVPNKGDVTAAPPGVSSNPNDPDDEHQGGTSVSGRKDGFYTILVMGQNYGLTDVMMVAGFDTVNHTIEVVSIPRDTYCTVITDKVKRVNGAYNDGGRKIEHVYEAVESLIGFRPDKYMLIDYDGFVKLVDTIGGVEFDVPRDMDHWADDGSKDINLKKGYQMLNGKQALGLVRYRKGYADQDLGRIRTAQKFLAAAAKKAMSTISFDKIDDYVDIVVDYVKTDLTAGELIWFMQQAMSVDMENDLNFHAPAAGKELDAPTFNGSSYVCLRADKWLQMINSTVNPYTWYITFDDVDIVNPGYTPSESYLPEGAEEDESVAASAVVSPNQGTTTISATQKPTAQPTAKPTTKPTAKPTATPKPAAATPKPATTTPKPAASPKPSPEPDEPRQTSEPTVEPTTEPSGQPDEPDIAPEPSEEPFVPATHE